MSVQSSLQLRKVPGSILLSPEWQEEFDNELIENKGEYPEQEHEEAAKSEAREGKNGVFHRLCLSPRFSLREQLMLTFGVVSGLTILFVMAVSIAVGLTTGEFIHTRTVANLEENAQAHASSSARYVSEAFAPALPRDVSGILRQVVLDRFAGYPDAEGYEHDAWVPFRDMVSGTNKYPVDAPPLPMDWQIGREGNVNSDNVLEHFGDRWDWYGPPESTPISTASAFFFTQGSCDPNVTDPNQKAYRPNCTEPSNDVSSSSDNAEAIYSKGKDLSPFLKALHESNPIIKRIGMYFANAGAGAVVGYPHRVHDRRSAYESIGCDWMLAENPLEPSELIGTEENITRCHAKGDNVSMGEYNPLERAWFRDMALDPGRVHFVGPYLDAGTKHQWIMTVGQAVYDRVTKKLIGCTLIDVDEERLTEMLQTVRLGVSSQITLTKWDEEGTVMSSPYWESETANDVTTVDDPELGVGLSAADFAHLENLVNFSDPQMTAEIIQKEYTEEVISTGSKMVCSYPVPPPPVHYDGSYQPDFMVTVTLGEEDVYRSFQDLEETVDAKVWNLITFTLIIGCAGLVGIMLIIVAMSSVLTRPLLWMRDVSEKIVSNFGNEDALPQEEDEKNRGNAEKTLDMKEEEQLSKEDIRVDVERKTCLHRIRCCCAAPRTELSDLTDEFKLMISNFNSDGTAARSVQMGSRLIEVRNRFRLQNEFEELYQSRNNSEFKYRYSNNEAKSHFDKSSQGNQKELDVSERTNGSNPDRCVSVDLPGRVHFGTNVIINEDDSSNSAAQTTLLENSSGHVVRTRLFRCIVGLLITPLVLVTVTISVAVDLQVYSKLKSLETFVMTEYLDLERHAANTAADLRALHASQVMQRSSRELHIYQRMAGWLLFDGLNRTADAFTGMRTGAEGCKTAGGRGLCDYIINAPCDCAWGDPVIENCTDFSEMEDDSRYLQEMFFEGQRQDTWPNGDRNYTSIPATSADQTSFFDDPLTVPGYERGSLAHGYETTYDRLRVISALSVILMPLYNYDVGFDKLLGVNIGFEADGMLVGYSGCNHAHADYAFWSSTEENGAADLNKDLCPVGKYGYDARCRDWYHNGKVTGNNTEGAAPLHVTPPYLFASTAGLVAQGATLPLVDPRNENRLVGIAVLDFLSREIFRAMNSTRLVSGGFPLLITTQRDVLGDDTVIGPNFTVGVDAARAEEVVVPYDWTCSRDSDKNCPSGTRFDAIVTDMRAGGRGNSTFVRTGQNGNMEKMYISYAPVNVSSYRTLDHSDFSRGTKIFSSLVYSLAFVEPEEGLVAPFADDYNTIVRMIRISVGVLSVVIVLASSMLIYISARVTVSITVPVLHLFKTIQSVNRLENKEDFTPPKLLGSSEISAVNDTLNHLFKVIRFANAAFFSGDIEKAYWVFVDALRLFRKLKNGKAIGIASNNLGNCMLAMYRTLEEMGESKICGLSKDDIISKGTVYFQDAIKLGEEAYDKFYEEQGWSASCLVFMQHLSSRYFNRAIFLLTVKKDHKYPEDADRLGFQDLDIAKNMDVEVVDQCLEVGFSVNKSELFDLMLNRVRGVLSLMEMEYPDEWGIEEQIHNAVTELNRALKNRSSDLFRDVLPAGRKQEMDTELIRHAQLRGATEEAARIAIRMLVEDEYIFYYAELTAVKSLVSYIASKAEQSRFSSETMHALVGVQHDIEASFKDIVSQRLSDIEGPEQNKLSWSKSSQEAQSTKMATPNPVAFSLRQTFRGDFTMEAI